MFSILDNQAKIKKLDKSDLLKSIQELGAQCADAWRGAKKIKIPASYKKVSNVVVNGMGASGLGGHIIQFLFWDKLRVPLKVMHDYTVPACVGRDTLFVVSSYSGTTEEPLNTIGLAKKRGAKVLGISHNATLGSLITDGKIPGFVFDDKHNHTHTPRMGVGYSIFSQLAMFQKCGLVNLSEREVRSVLKTIKAANNRWGIAVPRSRNLAKQTAEKICGKFVCVVAADFLAGNAHVFSNQINESSKNFATYFLIPELNHHLLEGLGHPKKGKKDLEFLFVQSDLYYPKNQKRVEVTKDVVENNSVDFVECKLQSKTKLEQSFELLVFGSYVSFYLGMLNGIDPTPNSWVDYFKERLKK